MQVIFYTILDIILLNIFVGDGIMDLQRVHSILNNKEKSDVFYDERPVWIQGVDEKRDIAKVGFVDNFEEQDVYIEDLYEKDLFN